MNLLDLPVESNGEASCNCPVTESEEKVFFFGVCRVFVCLGTMGPCEQDAVKEFFLYLHEVLGQST